MSQNNFGKIINISSVGGQWGGFNQVHYAATKAALINLTMSIAKIYSNKGINCNAIAIGLVNTDMIANELQTISGKNKVKNIKSPVLILHGEADQIVPFDMGKKIFSLANEPKYSYFTKTDNHMMEFDENLLKALNSFLKSLN